jgi:hypothetical protein
VLLIALAIEVVAESPPPAVLDPVMQDHRKLQEVTQELDALRAEHSVPEKPLRPQQYTSGNGRCTPGRNPTCSRKPCFRARDLTGRGKHVGECEIASRGHNETRSSRGLYSSRYHCGRNEAAVDVAWHEVCSLWLTRRRLLKRKSSC